jgi:hypothetical protein
VGAAPAALGAFEDDAIAFFDAVDRRGVFAELFHAPEDFVAENQWVRQLGFAAMEILYVRAADSSKFDFYEPAVRQNIGYWILANFQLVGSKKRDASACGGHKTPPNSFPETTAIEVLASSHRNHDLLDRE